MKNDNIIIGSEEFTLFNLSARCNFKTETSISFVLCEGSSAVFRSRGRVEVHHPCGGHFNARIRFWLPMEYIEFDNMVVAVQAVLNALQIPQDETHEAIFFEGGFMAFYMNNFELNAGGRENG